MFRNLMNRFFARKTKLMSLYGGVNLVKILRHIGTGEVNVGSKIKRDKIFTGQPYNLTGEASVGAAYSGFISSIPKLGAQAELQFNMLQNLGLGAYLTYNFDQVLYKDLVQLSTVGIGFQTGNLNTLLSKRSEIDALASLGQKSEMTALSNEIDSLLRSQLAEKDADKVKEELKKTLKKVFGELDQSRIDQLANSSKAPFTFQEFRSAMKRFGGRGKPRAKDLAKSLCSSEKAAETLMGHINALGEHPGTSTAPGKGNARSAKELAVLNAYKAYLEAVALDLDALETELDSSAKEFKSRGPNTGGISFLKRAEVEKAKSDIDDEAQKMVGVDSDELQSVDACLAGIRLGSVVTNYSAITPIKVEPADADKYKENIVKFEADKLIESDSAEYSKEELKDMLETLNDLETLKSAYRSYAQLAVSYLFNLVGAKADFLAGPVRVALGFSLRRVTLSVFYNHFLNLQ